ncbi:MAG: thrombospondin type 3 repeat-containing protein, partial [candidate division WOR-3 bacterium]
MFRYILLLLSMLVLWVFSLACDHRTYYSPPATGRHYVPQQIPIKPGMIGTPEFTVSKVITLVNAQANTDWTLLGAYTHQWWGNLKMWTDTAIGVTANELKKKGATVKDDLPLMLKLALSRDQASSMLVGVVSRECPMDPEKRMERPLDTDEDGVPDYLDKCPDTPKGVRVNSLGCPLDTDGDSVPDYRDHCPRIPQGYRIDNMPFGEEEAALSDHPEDRFSSSRTFLVSPHPADRVMRLFRKELERQGMKVDKDTPDMLRFETPAQEWRDKLPAIQTALEKEGVQLTSRAPRILQLAVTGASLEWNSGEIGCTLSLRAITGDGDILDFKGTNRARDLYDSCNGAITKQVAAMFNDDRVRVYLAA